MAQRNLSDIVIDKKNARFLGLHLLGVRVQDEAASTTTSNNVPCSSTHLGSGLELKMRENGAGVNKSIVGSDAGTEASWESIGPQRWAKKLQHEAMMEHDWKKEQDTDFQTPPCRRSRPSGSAEENEKD